MDGSLASGGTLTMRLVERLTDLDRRIDAERARNTPDQAALRRLTRERSLERDRMACLSGAAMPRWARGE